MSHPRTPEHFPRMKVRGGRRRRDARIRQAWRGASHAFVRIEADFRAFADAMRGVGRALAAVRTTFWLARRRARDQWLSRHMLTDTPSPWAAPIGQETP